MADVRLRTTIKGTREVQGAIARLGTGMGKLQQSVFSLRGALVGLGAAFALRSIVQTNAEFQRLQAQLTTVTGSVKKANAEWTRLLKFTTETPFQIKNVVTAFTQLESVGIKPTEERLRAFGDIAAGMGKDITEFAGAVVGAVTGEMDRLKQFGIVGRQQGDQIELIFKGQTITIERSADAITDALTKIAKTDFAGGMARQMDTLGGVFSNLQDAAALFADAIGRGGLNDAIKDVTRSMIDMTAEGETLARNIGQTLGSAIRGVGAAFEFLAANIEIVTVALGALAGAKFGSLFGPIGAGIGLVVGAIGGLITNMTLLEEAQSNLNLTREQAIQLSREQRDEALRTAKAEAAALRGLIATMEEFDAAAASGFVGDFSDPDLDRAKRALDVVTETIANITAAAGEAADASDDFDESLKKTGQAAKTSAFFLETVALSVTKVHEAQTAFAAGQRALLQEESEQAQVFFESMIADQDSLETARADARQKAEDDLQRDLDNQEKRQQTIIKDLTDMRVRGLAVARDMNSAFRNFFFNVFTGAEKFSEAMKNLFKDLVESILSELARLAANSIFFALLNILVPGAGAFAGASGFNPFGAGGGGTFGGGGGAAGLTGGGAGAAAGSASSGGASLASGFTFFQRGGSFIANEPRVIGVGEIPEQITVTPLNRGGGRQSGGVTIIIDQLIVPTEAAADEFFDTLEREMLRRAL